MRSIVWNRNLGCVCNHCKAVNVIRNLFRYVINTKDCIHQGDAIRLRQLHTRWSVITYQSFGLDKKTDKLLLVCFLVGAGGFEPPKAVPTDLQSAPFGHSGTLPHIHYSIENKNGAGGRTRTPDLLITNQLLYQLSYTGGSNRTRLL